MPNFWNSRSRLSRLSCPAPSDAQSAEVQKFDEIERFSNPEQSVELEKFDEVELVGEVGDFAGLLGE